MEIRNQPPTLAEMIAAFNPNITKAESEKKADFIIEDVTPQGYEPAN